MESIRRRLVNDSKELADKKSQQSPKSRSRRLAMEGYNVRLLETVVVYTKRRIAPQRSTASKDARKDNQYINY